VSWILSIASMTLGGMIYVLWRPESLWMFSWFAALGVDQPVTSMRAWAAPLSGLMPGWIYLSLPQSLWLLSGCLAIHSIWGNWRCRREQCWMALVLSLALGGELGQAVGIIEGVFDFWDLALILVAFLGAQTVTFACDRCTRTRRTT